MMLMDHLATSNNNNNSHAPSCRHRKTVVLCDWDDSLLPSTHLMHLTQLSTGNSNHINHNYLQDQQDLRALEQHVIDFLQQALAVAARVTVVTNSEEGWVELSCQRFFPRVLPLLERVRIVSARSLFEHAFPRQPQMWKLAAFRQELWRESPTAAAAAATLHLPLNVISVGDSLFEREAVYAAGNELAQPALIKSIKLVDKPGMKELSSQLMLLARCLGDVVNHDCNLDLWLDNQSKRTAAAAMHHHHDNNNDNNSAAAAAQARTSPQVPA